MSPAAIALILSLVEEAVQVTPGLVTDLQAIFSTSNPSPADWEALRGKVLSKSYADYVPASALNIAATPEQNPPVTTAAPQSNAPISQPGASPAPYLADGTPNPEFSD